MEHSQLEAHIGAPRLRMYLREAAGDPDRAEQLYVWNSRLAAAFFVDLGHVEVALRNALHARMSARHAKHGLAGSWLEDPTGELGRDLSGARQPRHEQPYKDIDIARRRVRHNKKRVDDGQVISETSLGLWHQLVSKKHTRLWPDLAGAFPHAPNRARTTVAEPIERLRDVRNRIGHHHRIWQLDIPGLHGDVIAVAGYIDPELSRWIDTHSQVRRVFGGRPESRDHNPE